MGSQRIVEVVEDLERTLLDFIHKHRITHQEYRQATELVITSVKQGEESLLLDVFLEAAATDVANTGRAGSMAAIEGPFYLPDAPVLARPHVMPQRPRERGEHLVFTGTVTATDGTPLVGAELDMWQADADGCYSGIHPGVPEWNLRGRFTTEEDGSFQVRTILPPPYEIPKHGPTGRVLDGLGRHFFRPAHLHVKVRATGHEELTSQLYFAEGDYLDSDVASAVRDGLVLELRRGEGTAEVSYDFVLAPRP
jgi:catechol 1,2-dioxygenase